MPPDVPVVIPPRDAQRHVIHRPALPDLLEPYSFNSLADFRTSNPSLYLVYRQARDIAGEELGVLPQDISYTSWDKAYRRIFKEADPPEQDDRETATSLRGKSQRRSRIAKMLTLRPKESLVDSTESSAGEDDEADENNGDDEGGAPPDKGKQRMADPDAAPVIPALASPANTTASSNLPEVNDVIHFADRDYNAESGRSSGAVSGTQSSGVEESGDEDDEDDDESDEEEEGAEQKGAEDEGDEEKVDEEELKVSKIGSGGVQEADCGELYSGVQAHVLEAAEACYKCCTTFSDYFRHA